MNNPEIDQEKFEKFQERLKKGALVKAVKGWKKSNIPFELIESQLLKSIQSEYKNKNTGIILSVYYEIGQIAQYSISDLLDILYGKTDYPTFLKQAYRFGVYQGFEEKIKNAIAWHEVRKTPDAFAWRLKFEKLKEGFGIEKLGLPNFEPSENSTTTIKVIDSEQSEEKKDLIYFELKPLKRKENTSIKNYIDEAEQQPYFLSKVAKKKLENANLKHSLTLKILKNRLTALGYDVLETKHIDAFAVVKNNPAIFEIKSINEENENDQVRAAISQLYEYRFLYSLKNATLWIVFSEKPFSDWIITYLSQDREIKVLWVENNELTGVSQQHLN